MSMPGYMDREGMNRGSAMNLHNHDGCGCQILGASFIHQHQLQCHSSSKYQLLVVCWQLHLRLQQLSHNRSAVHSITVNMTHNLMP